MFVAENISYRIGRKEILNDCSLTLKPGKFTAIVGPNGAGKTSLLKVMSNETTKCEGHILLNGKETKKINNKEISRQRAVLPQNTSLNFPFTIEQVIEIGRYPHNTIKAENDRIISDVIAQTNLTNFKGRVYQTLSGGEQQRVQLARVMAQMWDETVFPKYLLLDEPTASLDISQQHNIMHLARQTLSRNMGVMAIIHDLNLAVQYADYIIFMKEGKIIAQGMTRDVLSKEIIEETFSHPVQLLTDEGGRTVVCPIPNSTPQQSQSKINLTQTSYGKLNYN